MPFASTRKALEYCAHGLAGESGEFSELVKKWAYHGHDMDRVAMAKELGDIGWYLAVAAHKLGFTLEDVLQANLDKLTDRYPEGFSTERSINRDREEG
jgi:NTP pyrophosphatase (non-canonical NTP hydrolase)